MQKIQDAIDQRVTVAAPRERVWQALTSAEQIRAWWAPEGSSVDLRVGGTFTNSWDGGTSRATYVEIDEPCRLAFTWVPGDLERADVPLAQQGQTLVEFTLVEADDGGTIVTVRESGFSSLSPADRDRAYPMNVDGWTDALTSLAQYVEA